MEHPLSPEIRLTPPRLLIKVSFDHCLNTSLPFQRTPVEVRLNQWTCVWWSDKGVANRSKIKVPVVNGATLQKDPGGD
jgi:hypothetical protein